MLNHFVRLQTEADPGSFHRYLQAVPTPDQVSTFIGSTLRLRVASGAAGHRGPCSVDRHFREQGLLDQCPREHQAVRLIPPCSFRLDYTNRLLACIGCNRFLR